MREKPTFDGSVSQGMVSERAVKTPLHSDEMYRQLAESSSDFIYVIDREFRVKYVNQAGAGALRMSPEEATGKYLTELFPPDTAEKMTGALARVFISGKPQSNEMTHSFFHRDFHMHVSLNPILDDEGNIDSVMGISRDITDLKNAEQTLRQSEEMYRGLVEEFNDWICDVDEHFVCTYSSPRVRNVLGYEPDEVIGRSAFDFMPPGEGDRLKAMIPPGSKASSGFDLIQCRLLRNDGRVVWTEIAGKPVVDSQGRFKYNRGLIRDITERKRAEEALQLTQFALDNFLDSAIWVTPDGSIAYVNRAACNTLGYSREELLSMHISDIDPNYTPEQFRELWPEKLQGRYINFESKHVARDGRAFPVEITSCYTRYWDKELLITFDRDITERKRMEEELRVSEEKYRSLVEEVGDLVWDVDEHSICTYVSPRSRDILGYKPEEMIGRSLYEFMAPGEADRLKSMKDGGPKSLDSFHLIEFTMLRKDGSPIIVETSGIPLFDDQARLKGNRGVIRDITERKRAEAMVRASEANLAHAERMARLGHWSLNPLTGEITGSKELFEIYSFNPEGGLSYEKFVERVHPDDLAAIEAADREAMKTGQPVNLDYRIVLPDGSLRYIHSEGEVKYDKAGNPVEVFGIAQDITERRRTEEILKQNQFILAKSQETAHLGNWVWNVQTYEISGSDENWRIIGLPVGGTQMTMQKYLQIIHSSDLEMVTEHTISLQREGQMCSVDYRIVRPDGSTVYVNTVTDDVVRDRAGKIKWVYGINQDITERKKIEKALAGAKARAEFYVDLMGHDINNMHQVALGYLELARDLPADGGQQAEFLDKSVEVLQRSTLLIQNVRKLQKIHEGEFQSKDVDVCKILADIQSEYGAVPGKMITLKMKCHDSCIVRANELLHDVYANLVNNSIKHTVGRTEIAIDMDVIEDNGKHYCQVAVEDNGPGVPDGNKERIFNSRHMGSSRGMGLGLYIVKSLVESYGGRVWVEDRVKGDHSKGARFVVTLPAVEK